MICIPLALSDVCCARKAASAALPNRECRICCISGIILAKTAFVGAVGASIYFYGAVKVGIALGIVAASVAGVVLLVFIAISICICRIRHPNSIVSEYREIENSKGAAKSAIYEIDESRPLPNGEKKAKESQLGIGFINGMGKGKEAAEINARHFSSLSGSRKIVWVHNAIHGLINDLLECVAGLNGIATEPVKLLQEMWKRFFDSNPNGIFLQICHSQGAIHVRNALSEMSEKAKSQGLATFPDILRKRIYVLALAPAAYIDPNTCGFVHHYVVKTGIKTQAFTRSFFKCFRWFSLVLDPVPLVDRTGRTKFKNHITWVKSHDAVVKRIDHSCQSVSFMSWVATHIHVFTSSDGKRFALSVKEAKAAEAHQIEIKAAVEVKEVEANQKSI